MMNLQNLKSDIDPIHALIRGIPISPLAKHFQKHRSHDVEYRHWAAPYA